MKYPVTLRIPGVMSAGEPAAQTIIGTFQSVLAHALERCKFRHDAVENFILTDPVNMADIIYELQDQAGLRRGYTSEHGTEFLTAAKTIPRQILGEVKSSIVMLVNFVDALVEKIDNEIPIEDWSADELHWLYIPAHEIGHAEDYFIRRHHGGDKIDLAQERDREKLGLHYAGVLIGEFLACYYSGGVVTPTLQEYLSDQWRAQSDNLVRSVARQKFDLMGDPFYFAAHNLWFVMVDFSKQVAHSCRNPALSSPALWEHADDCEKEVFSKLELFLRNELAPVESETKSSHRSQDPAFDLENHVFVNLEPLWEEFCGCVGLYFGEMDDESETF